MGLVLAQMQHLGAWVVLNRLLPSFFPFLQMVFDPTVVEPAGKAQMKESYKDLFPTALF